MTAWQETLAAWWRRSFRPLLVAVLVGCGVHYTIYSNNLINFDAEHVGSLYIADGWAERLYWETQQGRWALRLVDMLRGGINQPALAALLMLLLYAVAGVMLTELFAVRGRLAKYLIPLTLVCAPYVAEVETYHYCNVSYALSYLLAVLAVQAAVSDRRFRWLAGSAALAFALGLYQANLGTAAGLCVMLLVLLLLRQPEDWRTLGRTAGRMLLMGGVGAALYMVILKIFLAVYHTELAAINGIGGVGLGLLLKLPLGIKNAWYDFYAYFCTHAVAQNHYGQRAGYLLLFLLAGYALVRWLWQLRSGKTTAAVLVLLALLPAAVNVTDVLNTETLISLRMAGGLATVVPFAVALLDASPRANPRTALAYAACCAVLLRGFAVQVNNDAAVLLQQKTMIVSFANRLCTRLEQEPDYQNGAPVVILGEPKHSFYSEVSALTPRASDLVQAGQLSFDVTFNGHGWYMLFWDELGVRLNECEDEMIRGICNTEEFKAMPCYPQEGCVMTIAGVVTLKVADIQ